MTKVYRTPWLESEHTQIWNVTELARRAPDSIRHKEDDASLAIWLVHAPWMSAGIWHWHYVGLIHLRDLPGQSKAPHLHFPEATHEVMAFAVDPETQPDLSASEWVPLHFLSPASIVQQFAAENDAAALGAIEAALHTVKDGIMTLESDGRSAWQNLLLRGPSL